MTKQPILMILMGIAIMIAGTPLVMGASTQTGFNVEEFADAISEDRLALIPANIGITINIDEYLSEVERYCESLETFNDDEYLIYVPGVESDFLELTKNYSEELNCFSMSPDGNQFFAVTKEGLPFTYNLITQSLKILPPDKKMDPRHYSDQYQQIFDRAFLSRSINKYVVWSKDGKYVSIACLLIVDIEAGVVKHFPGSIGGFDSEFPAYYKIGTPFRSTFSENEPLLYYELVSAENKDLKQHNEIWSYNLLSGETNLLSAFEFKSYNSVLDEQMWKTELGFIQTVHDYEGRNGLDGIAIRGIGKPDVLVKRSPDNKSAYLLGGELIGSAGNIGVLEIQHRTNYGVSLRTYHLFELSNLSGGLFDNCIMINPSASAPNRLQLQPWADIPHIYTEKSDIYREPWNATLSPDGKHLLLLTQMDIAQDPKLFIYDIEHMILGEIDISGAEPDLYNNSIINFWRGMTWLGNNRILDNEYFRVFELIVIQKD